MYFYYTGIYRNDDININKNILYIYNKGNFLKINLKQIEWKNSEQKMHYITNPSIWLIEKFMVYISFERKGKRKKKEKEEEREKEKLM